MNGIEKEKTVKHPILELPNYELPEGASIQEMRDMAVRAMHDELTFEWTPERSFTYRKSGSCADKNYEFNEGAVYGGLPYTTGGTGIFQFGQYMDLDTGLFHACDAEHFPDELGNSCAASVNWGVSAVCTSIRGGVSTYWYTYRNGWFPLGDVKYPAHICSFGEYFTDQICRDNGKETVLEGYALAKKADAVIATDKYPKQITARHAMMLIEDPVVVRTADGKIDAEASYIVEQDQRSKDKPVETEEGYTVSYRGRTSHAVTFAELYEKGYIAMTTLEFAGKRPYEVGRAETDIPVNSVEELFNAKILANYRTAVYTLTATAGDGSVVYAEKKVSSGIDSEDGCMFTTCCPVSECFDREKLENALTGKKNVTVKVEVLLATGGTRTAVTFSAAE